MNKHALILIFNIGLISPMSFASSTTPINPPSSEIFNNSIVQITSSVKDLTQDWVNYKKIDDQINTESLNQNEDKNFNINTQFANKTEYEEFSAQQMNTTLHNMLSIIESYSPQTPEFKKLKQIKIKLIETYHKYTVEQAMNKPKKLMILSNQPSEIMIQIAYLLDESDELEAAIKEKIGLEP